MQLVDEWLDNAKYSLEERGDDLEILAKNELSISLRDKGSYVMPEINIFRISKNIFEEIDLIISFDDFIIIGEIKNVKYPMEARNYHNSLKRITDGAEQVLRKKDFILKNKQHFNQLLNGIEGKEVYCMVICNYPHFTGMQIMGVPIIDYMAFHTYMDKGVIQKSNSTFDKHKKEINTKIIERKYLWKNKKEFFENFKSYLDSPTFVEEMKSKINIKDMRITINNIEPEIYIQQADIIK
ncbi:hypothetical protein D3C74_306630 [compost metagenome]